MPENHGTFQQATCHLRGLGFKNRLDYYHQPIPDVFELEEEYTSQESGRTFRQQTIATVTKGVVEYVIHTKDWS